MKTFSIKEAIKFGWQKFKSNYWFYLGVIVTVGICSWFPEYARSKLPENQQFLKNVYQVLGILLSSTVTLGFIKIVIKSVDGKNVFFADLFKNYRFLLKYWVAEILAGIITVGGFFLFIIPGIILAVKFQFIDYFIIDKNDGPIAALKSSWKVTKGIKWQLFLFGLTIIFINLLGLLALGVGIAVTYPITTLAQAYVYRSLTREEPKQKNIIKRKEVK